MDPVDVLLIPFPREYSYNYSHDYLLENLVSRIVTRYGAFRKLKASSFIDMEKESDDSNYYLKKLQDSDISDVLPDLKYDVQQAREKLINMIFNAQNECSLILDFVSLLVSSVKPTQGVSTMSTFLKERVPLGSFGTERVKGDILEDDGTISKGWKLQALSKAASDLLDASVRIEKETSLETKFWDQVNLLKQNGWNLMHSRINQSRNLAVNYGIMDITRVFGKGFAVLQRNIDGGIKFDGIDMIETFKTTRLRLVENNSIKGEVIWDNSSFFQLSDKNIQILSQRRDSFFEEELVEEIIREVKLFDDLNAIIMDNGVSVKFFGYKWALLIDIVDASTETKECNREYDVLCEAMLLAIHLFFSYYESQKLKWSDNLPFLSKTQTKKQPCILFPVLSQLLHYFVLNEIFKELDNCVNVILAEDWTINYKVRKYVGMNFGVSEDSIIQAIVNGARSVVEMHFPRSSQMIINIQTINCKTLFEIDFHDAGKNEFMTSKISCENILQVLDCVIWSINKDLARVLQERVAPEWKIKNGELVNINNGKRIKIDIFLQRNENGVWKVFLYKNGISVVTEDGKISDYISKII